MPRNLRLWLLWIAVPITTGFLLFYPLGGTSTQTLTYSTFVTDVSANQVKSAAITSDGTVSGVLTAGGHFTTTIPTALDNPTLSKLLLDHGVAVTATPPSGTPFSDFLLSWAPFLVLGGLSLWFYARARRHMTGEGTRGGGLGSLMGIGSSRAKLYDTDRPAVHFDDIAGYDTVKAEVKEVVDYLKHPEPYARAGATGPKGILMAGPPGTGKTLMARAVAGEAGVPFFALTGSSFVEMFVGVGASRVRSLFNDARRRAPAIIFIDEIDAIGGRRGVGGFAGNDEREQTLNQLLSEMDGFEPGSSVVVIAATNRPEVLDSALLRPGRFDRTVDIPLPNQTERTQILQIHTRGKTLAPDVDLDAVSRGTPGLAGADLANLVNEAAIHAVRRRTSVIHPADFDAARDRILLGNRSSTSVLLPAEKTSVAVHETGHALVALLCEHADPVAKVTILPRGAALGVTEQLPINERHLYPVSYLLDTLKVRLGGRAAELVVLGEASTGASNDLASATDLAIRMVKEWGLSTALGPVGYPERQSPQYPFGGDAYAQETQRVIDLEVAQLLRHAETEAMSLLDRHRDALDRIVRLLLDRETISGDELITAAGLEVPARSGDFDIVAPALSDDSAGAATVLP